MQAICKQQDLPRSARFPYLKKILYNTLNKIQKIYSSNKPMYTGRIYYHPFNTETDDLLPAKKMDNATIQFKNKKYKYYSENNKSTIITNSIFLHGGFIFEVFCEYLVNIGIKKATIPDRLNKLRSMDIDIQIYLDFKVNEISLQPYDIDYVVMMNSMIKNIINKTFIPLLPNMTFNVTHDTIRSITKTAIGIPCKEKFDIDIVDIAFFSKIEEPGYSGFYVHGIGLILDLKTEIINWVNALEYYRTGRPGWTDTANKEKTIIYRYRLEHMLTLIDIARNNRDSFAILAEFDDIIRPGQFTSYRPYRRHPSFQNYI